MADYNMRNTGASVDDIVENGLDKRVGGVVTGDIEATNIKANDVRTDALSSKDDTISVDITTLCDTNIVNIGKSTIPTVDPGIPGRIWSDAGTLKVSL